MVKNTGQRASPAAVRAGVPTWSTWTQVAAVVMHPMTLRRTLSISIAVGTVFFCMNQLPAILGGQLTVAVAVKTALTYLVPFCTSNYGILVASRRPSIDRDASKVGSAAFPLSGGAHPHGCDAPM
jgi:hypothetical protein